jgi:hypothetical protein
MLSPRKKCSRDFDDAQYFVIPQSIGDAEILAFEIEDANSTSFERVSSESAGK